MPRGGEGARTHRVKNRGLHTAFGVKEQRVKPRPLRHITIEESQRYVDFEDYIREHWEEYEETYPNAFTNRDRRELELFTVKNWWNLELKRMKQHKEDAEMADKEKEVKPTSVDEDVPAENAVTPSASIPFDPKLDAEARGVPYTPEGANEPKEQPAPDEGIFTFSQKDAEDKTVKPTAKEDTKTDIKPSTRVRD